MDQKRSHNELDRLLREKMTDMQPDYDPTSWDRLAQRLDMEDARDLRFAEKLRRLQVPYNADSWSVLSARLEKEQARLQAVLHYKAMELSLALLLLITLWQYFQPAPVTPAAPMPAPHQLFRPLAPIAAIGQPLGPLGAATQQATEEEESHWLLFIPKVPILAYPIASATDAHPAEPSTKVATKLPSRKMNLLDAMPRATLPSSLTVASPTPVVSWPKLTAPPHDSFKPFGPLASLADAPIGELDYGDAEDLLSLIKPIDRRAHLRVGFLGSADYNRVLTPETSLRDTVVSLDRYALGYSGGLTIGVERGRWEMELGFIYAARRYQTIPALYVSGELRSGYYARGLGDFELNTITLPLNWRYNVFVHDKWRMYGLAGAGLNMVVQANYYSVTEEAYQLRFSSDPPPTSGARRPTVDDNKFKPGWLEGGFFMDNATLYSNFGVGIERYMAPRWSIFAQPTYQHSIPFFNKGLGPYNDRIHSFSIYLGMKVGL